MTSSFLTYALKEYSSCYTFPYFERATTSKLLLVHKVSNTSLHPSQLLAMTAIIDISINDSQGYGLPYLLFPFGSISFLSCPHTSAFNKV